MEVAARRYSFSTRAFFFLLNNSFGFSSDSIIFGIDLSFFFKNSIGMSLEV
jgi:hypothetical protein